MTRTPYYLELASTLRLSIVSGQYIVGDRLPTEYQLSESFNVSRYTVRGALKLLEEEELIERIPGRGTLVTSTGTPRTFVQALGGLNDLLQYAHEARLKVISSECTILSLALARSLGATRASRWLQLEGMRIASSVPIAATTVYVTANIGADASQFGYSEKSVTEIIEERFGITVSAIDQSIQAELLSSRDAKALGMEPNGPVLRTIRRYYDESERLFVISNSRHPGDRFAYEMSYKRSR
jgi:GntR family transcriptional regulator